MEQTTSRPDHLWVLVVIAAAALAEVWGSWVGIGSISGFPVLLGKIPTDWVLALVMEGYWAYGLYAWLAASPGPRSRGFAMWSCGVVFILSLVGQVTYHEMTVPPDTSIGRRVVVGFVTVLPVTGLALIAVLIHLRHADRETVAAAVRTAAEAERRAAIERAEADERTALRAELDALKVRAETDLSALRDELDAERDARKADAAAAARSLELALKAARKADPKARARTARERDKAGAQDDATTELRALMEFRSDPRLLGARMGAKLADKLGVHPSTGRRLHGRMVEGGQLRPEYAAMAAPLAGEADARE